jgi:MarR family transcriptional regulator, 2-MHQ and catechol-resistance regulon repressor
MKDKREAGMGKLQDVLRKQQPFGVAEQEAALNLFRTSDRLQHRFARLFREYGLTPSQYNILRILRGEGKPMPCLEIAQRTITVVPGITGLIDRLEEADPPLVSRQRSAEDRRVVHVSITQAGLDVLARLDEPLLQLHKTLLAPFTPDELAELIRLLEKARQKCEDEAS